jgi:NitT/TauT family transport system substrate-binding protein
VIFDRKRTILCVLMFALGHATVTHAANIALKVGVAPIIDMAQVYAAVDQGYFRDEGLDVETAATGNIVALLPGLTAGQLQFVAAPIVTVLQGIESGIKFRVVAPGTAIGVPPPDISPIVTLADGPVKTPRDLEGRTLAVPSLNGNLWLYSRAWLEKKGVDLSKVKILEVPFPQQFDALTTGRVDAASMTEPFATRATESGKGRILGYPYTETQTNFVSVVLVTMADWATANPNAFNRFVRAYLRGQAYMNQHKKDPEGVKLISSYTKLDPAVVAKIAVPAFPPTVDTQAIEETARLMVRHGLLKSAPDIKSIMYMPTP